MKRRDFIKTSVMAGAALTLDFDKLGAALSSNSMAVEQVPDMVAIMGGEPEVMLDKALNELGGIGKSLSNPISVGTEVRRWLVIPIRS